MSRGQSLDERFFSRVRMTDGCWIWTGCSIPKGHGQIYHDGRMRPAHRVAYEQLVGPVSDDLDVDHLCRNPACVRPDHLEPVTRRENVLRGRGSSAQNARKTHCKRGHPFTPENTMTRIVRGRPTRRCRACNYEDARRWRARQKESA